MNVSENARALLLAIDAATEGDSGLAAHVGDVAAQMQVSTQKVNGIINGAVRNGLVEKPGRGLVALTGTGLTALNTSTAATVSALAEGPGGVSTIIACLEALWRRFQEAHPGLPNVAIIVSTGVVQGRYQRRGHWHANQWAGIADHEVMIAGERLQDGAWAVASTLLHEAAHGLAYAREIRDTSRQGRWHNKRFKAVAEGVGLVVGECPKRGHHTDEGMSEETRARYVIEVLALEAAIANTSRIVPPPKPEAEKKRRMPWKAVLQEIAEKVAAEGHCDEAAFGDILEAHDMTVDDVLPE